MILNMLKKDVKSISKVSSSKMFEESLFITFHGGSSFSVCQGAPMQCPYPYGYYYQLSAGSVAADFTNKIICQKRGANHQDQLLVSSLLRLLCLDFSGRCHIYLLLSHVNTLHLWLVIVVGHSGCCLFQDHQDSLNTG